jgi:hypothetical protein
MRSSLYTITTIVVCAIASVFAQDVRNVTTNSTNSVSSTEANHPKVLTTWTYNPVWPDPGEKQRALAPIATSRQASLDFRRLPRLCGRCIHHMLTIRASLSYIFWQCTASGEYRTSSVSDVTGYPGEQDRLRHCAQEGHVGRAANQHSRRCLGRHGDMGAGDDVGQR